MVEDEVGSVLLSGIPLLSVASSPDISLALLAPQMPRKLGPHPASRVPPDFVIALSAYCSASISPLVI